MDTKNIMIVGVGGQGTLLTSRVLGGVMMDAGYQVKMSEVHGMAQRGGSVVTFVRYGDEVFEPIVEEGCADVLIAFERLEALRYAHFLKKDGVLIVNDQRMDPMPVVMGAAEYPGKRIHIALDNARYQKCDIVRNTALSLGIDLIYIPPYSPNLNPIERLWKFIKGKLRARYYDNFEVFTATIDTIIDETQTVYKDEISSLIGEKVQLFDDLIPVCENTFIRRKSPRKNVA